MAAGRGFTAKFNGGRGKGSRCRLLVALFGVCFVALLVLWASMLQAAVRSSEGRLVVESLPPPPVVKVWAELYSGASCEGQKLVVGVDDVFPHCERCFDTCLQSFPDGSPAFPHTKSVRLLANDTWPLGVYADIGSRCSGEYHYDDIGELVANLTGTDGCYSVPEGISAHIGFLQWNGLAASIDEDWSDLPSYHIAYSCESSTYFGFQVYAGLYGFQNTFHPEGTGYTRLLTASGPDDLTELVDTFTADRDPYARMYVPINKPDVFNKWMQSDQAPKQDVVVIIDPDVWLTPKANLARWVRQVKKGHAVAQPGFFHGNPFVQEFYDTHICQDNCGWKVDTVGVPYFIHPDDLTALAPLWYNLTIVTDQLFRNNKTIAKHYDSMQPGWCAEMYGYVFAAAELGIRHRVMAGIQMRDVDTRLSKERTDKIPMIHVGRAWFPDDYEPNPWRHTEGADFSDRGQQVWCKCNFTANDIIPWPLAPGLDAVSNITLTYLHESKLLYPPLHPSEFRKTVDLKSGRGYGDKY